MSEVILNISGVEVTVPKDQLTSAIEAGRFEIKNDDLIAFKKADYETRLKNEKDAEYHRGKQVGVEMEWKDVRKELGIEVETKDRKKILEMYRDKITTELKIEPNKAVKERDDVINQLRANMAKIEEEKAGILSQYQLKEKQMQIDSALITAIPDKAATETISKNDISAMFRANGFNADIQDGKLVVIKDGQVLKNTTTLEPLNITDIMNKFVTDKGFMKNEGGRGAGDEGGKAKPGTLEAFIKEMESKDIKYGSDEYTKIMYQRIKDKTLTV